MPRMPRAPSYAPAVHPRSLRVAVIGVVPANKGSGSMLQAVVDALPGAIGDCRVDVLSAHPGVEVRKHPRTEVRVIHYRPAAMVFPNLPMALLARVLRALRLPTAFACRTKVLRSLAGADIVIDVAGISFSDGRGVPILVYNVLMTGTPLLLGRPVVKCAQALGPFDGFLTRVAARAVLPRVEVVCARGATTEQHLTALGLENVAPAGDLAFAMEHGADDDAWVAERIAPFVDREFVVVAPSAVVEGLCAKAGIDYRGAVVAFVRALAERGEHVVLVAHSSLLDGQASRVNDLPLVVDVGARVGGGDRVVTLAEPVSPTRLRALIERAAFLVTSRFHAMISGLATGTPVLVVGWSHKYGEVLADFGLERWCIDYEAISGEDLLRRYDELRGATAEVQHAIAAAGPAVRAKAQVNFDQIARVVSGRAA